MEKLHFQGTFFVFQNEPVAVTFFPRIRNMTCKRTASRPKKMDSWHHSYFNFGWALLHWNVPRFAGLKKTIYLSHNCGSDNKCTAGNAHSKPTPSTKAELQMKKAAGSMAALTWCITCKHLHKQTRWFCFSVIFSLWQNNTSWYLCWRLGPRFL